MRATGKNYYTILGVDPKDNAETIKSAFRRLAREYHPDVCKDADADERFNQLSEAYQILSDPTKRKQYDTMQALALGLDINELKARYLNPTVVRNTLRKVATGLAAAAGMVKSGKAKKGKDLRVEQEISFEQSYLGDVLEIDYGRIMVCQTCKGTGASQIEACPVCLGKGKLESEGFLGLAKRCPRCNGRGWRPVEPCRDCDKTGELIEDTHLKVRIPAGITNNQRMRIKSKGQQSFDEKERDNSGDLVLLVKIQPHSLLKRSGKDIHADLQVSLKTAALGGKVSVPFPHGNLSVQIPPHSWDGRMLRVIGVGFPIQGEDNRGDGFFRMQIQQPEKSEEQELFQRYQSQVTGNQSPVPEILAEELKNFYGNSN